MYESFFRLSHRPFAAAPSAEGYLPTAAIEQARTTLVRAIDRAEGPGLVVGPAGTGKTLVCQLLAKHFRGRFLVALLASARLCTRRALLQNILFELKLPYRDMDDGELRLSLIDHLEPRSGGNEGLLLLVDEAHTLPLRLLEEIRLITNLVRDGRPRVSLVLAGGMAIEERLANPKLESFHQRIACRLYLQPMGRDETIYYVREQLKRCTTAATTSGEIFTEPALRAIYTATDGIPRLVNQLCDHALMLAALGGHKQLGPEGIQEAWADLQQLPVPWHESRPACQQASAVVEFGQLDEPQGPQPAAGEPSVAASATQIGPYRSEEGDAAAARLDSIESSLSSLANEAGELTQSPAAASPITENSAARAGQGDEFSPADESATEVELIFHSAHDPFGSGWEEEEVVIDRYAMLDAARLRRVTSDESRRLAASLEAASQPLAPKLSVVRGEPAEAVPFDPASDPLLPDETPVPIKPRRAVASLRDLAGDDRDMIVVAEDQPGGAPSHPSKQITRPKRQEYRHLFSTLRKK